MLYTTGTVKILRRIVDSQDSLKMAGYRASYRVLMRQEQTLKIRANHQLNTDLLLRPMAGSERAWTYVSDYMCVHVCMYIYVYEHIHMYIYMYIWMSLLHLRPMAASERAWIYVSECMCTCVCVCVCIYVYT